MASDLDVSTATFGTADLVLASGDAIDDPTGYGWGSTVAQNTGWLYYQPRMLVSDTATIPDATDSFVTVTGHVYMPVGTYSIYGLADADTGGTLEGNGLLKLDGTTLVTFADATATTGSLCGWATDTARWVQVSVAGSADGGNIAVVHAVSARYGSWAP